MLRRIADGQYEIAARKDWPADLVKEARESHELFLREHPDVGSADRQAIRERIAKLTARGR